MSEPSVTDRPRVGAASAPDTPSFIATPLAPCPAPLPCPPLRRCRHGRARRAKRVRDSTETAALQPSNQARLKSPTCPGRCNWRFRVSSGNTRKRPRLATEVIEIDRLMLETTGHSQSHHAAPRRSEVRLPAPASPTRNSSQRMNLIRPIRNQVNRRYIRILT